MTVRRICIPPGGRRDDGLVFTGADAHYLRDVLRLSRGDRIVGFDGGGEELEAEITEVAPGRVAATVTGPARRSPERPYRVDLAQALLKGGKTETVLRQATELGVDGFIPLIAGNCVAGPGREPGRKIERWNRIVRDAARQAGRTRLPEVRPPTAWVDLIAGAGDWDLFLVAREAGDRPLGRAVGPDLRPRRILLAVGPEGGFDAGEIEAARDAGAVFFSLGPYTLRAVTAPVAALAVLHERFSRRGP